MKEYFTLQYKMGNRQLTEWGIEPLIGYVASSVLFVFISVRLFDKMQYAEYLYVAAALTIIIKLSEGNRTTFLKFCFSKVQYMKIRLIENGLFAAPFLIFLAYQQLYLTASVLALFSGLLSLMDLKYKSTFTLPTPFYKRPFEFAVGFRSNYFVFPFAYFLTFMAIYADNFNLGIFSLLLTFLCYLAYYTKPEEEFYVWVFALKPKEFLRYKLTNIIQYASVLSLPIVVILCWYFSENIEIIIAFQCLGYLFVSTVMLAKYAMFSEKLNIKFGVILVLSFWFPPLLVLIIPYLYFQSIKTLKKTLQ